MSEALQNPARPRRPAGLWARTLAFVIDALVLGVLGQLLGLCIREDLIALNGWGRAVGFVIALLYFVPLDSKLCAGRTLGKRIFKLRVAGRDGRPVDLFRSAARYTVIAIPWFLNNALLPPAATQPWFAVPLVVLIFGMGGSVLYLYFFNRGTGQGLHDLAAGTYVLAEGRDVPTASVARMHRQIVVAIFLLSIAAPMVLSAMVGSKAPYAQMQQAMAAAQATGKVFNSRIMKGVFYGKQTVRNIQFSVYLKRWPDDPKAESQQFARIVLDSFGAQADVDVVSVNLVYGFDIGIASAWKSYQASLPPMQWLQGKKP